MISRENIFLARIPSANVNVLLLMRHSFTTRWIFSGISSHLYYHDWTLDDLLGEFAQQAIDAFENGVCDTLAS